MKKLVLILFVALAVAGCKKSDGGWDVKVSGKLNTTGPGTITITELKANAKEDTVQYNSATGEFNTTVHLTEPGYYRLVFFQIQNVDLILNKSDVQIELTVGGNNQGLVVKGSPEMDLIKDTYAYIQERQSTPELGQLNEDYQAAAEKQDTVTMKQIEDNYAAAINAVYDTVAQRLKNQGPSLAVVNMLQSGVLQDRDRYFDLYVHVADELNKEWPYYSFTKEFSKQVEVMKKLAVGQPAPEIALPNPDGTVVKLSSFKGKFVLVDFWAKWCGPCRRENPNVVKAYKKYNKKGFEVFGVSLDRTREDWVKAINEDGLTWTHVSDLKYFDSQAAKDYDVNAIPFSILVDKDGIIVAKNLRGAALEKKLDQVLNGSL